MIPKHCAAVQIGKLVANFIYSRAKKQKRDLLLIQYKKKWTPWMSFVKDR